MRQPPPPFRQAANDVPKPASDRRIVVNWPTPWWLNNSLSLILFGLLIFFCGTGCGLGLSAWQKLSTDSVVPALPSVKSQPVIKVEVSPENTASKSGLTPIEPEKDAEIILPADAIAANAPVEDPTPVEKAVENPAAINLVAEKIGDLPVVQNGQRKAPFIEMTDTTPVNYEQLDEQARSLIKAGDFSDALQDYDRVLTQNSDDHEALAGKAFILARMGSYQAAVTASHRLLELYPDDTQGRSNLIAALGAAQIASAKKELQNIVAETPDDAAAQAALAQHLARDGDVQNALHHLDQAAHIDPGNLAYRLDLAVLYDRAGYSAQALEIYRQVMSMAEDAGTNTSLPISYETLQRRVAYLQNGE